MRPHGWKQPEGIGNETPPMAYEAGADAMIQGLLDSVDSYAPNSGELMRKLKNGKFGKGRLVFIEE